MNEHPLTIRAALTSRLVGSISLVDTMITKQERAKLIKAINRWASAEVDMSWRGGQPPEDHDRIDAEHRKARKALTALLSSLTTTTKATP